MPVYVLLVGCSYVISETRRPIKDKLFLTDHSAMVIELLDGGNLSSTISVASSEGEKVLWKRSAVYL